jgi:hypothetical protein
MEEVQNPTQPPLFLQWRDEGITGTKGEHGAKKQLDFEEVVGQRTIRKGKVHHLHLHQQESTSAQRNIQLQRRIGR